MTLFTLFIFQFENALIAAEVVKGSFLAWLGASETEGLTAPALENKSTQIDFLIFANCILKIRTCVADSSVCSRAALFSAVCLCACFWSICSSM